MRTRKRRLEVAGLVEEGFFGFSQVLEGSGPPYLYYGLGLRVGINGKYFFGLLLLLAVNQ